jgi:hypothetical protein
MASKIDPTKALEWYYTEEVVYAASKREAKALYVKISEPGFSVTVGGDVVWHGTHLETAIEKYNGITKKYQSVKETFRL